MKTDFDCHTINVALNDTIGGNKEMKVIISEKPDVMRKLAAVLAPHAKKMKSTYGTSYFQDDDLIFVSCLGHLFENKSPEAIDSRYKSWKLEDLPMEFPKEIPTELKRSDRGEKNYFKTIQMAIDQCDDEVVVATDADREGQHIFENMKKHLKNYHPRKETRMWITEMTDEAMQKAYEDRKSNSEYAGLRDAALCRDEADYKIGMNSTRAMTTKFGGYKNVISIGRVQTPTLKFVVDRELKIKNFVPEPYNVLALVTGSDSFESLTMKHKIKNPMKPNEAEVLRKKLLLHKDAVLSVKKTHGRTGVLNLYNTSEIQQDMNKRYGFSVSKTLDLLQSLYQDHALTTYPRTEMTVISESAAKDTLKVIQNIRGADTGCKDWIEEIFNKGYTISNKVVTKSEMAHEAITPVYGSINPSRIKTLTEDERKVYEAIVERFVQAFFPDLEYDETVVTTVLENQTFEAKGKIITEPGWTKVTGIKDDVTLPPITDKGSYPIKEIKMDKKKTTPPGRFTQATLVNAMENAARYVDDAAMAAVLKEEKRKGIGTGATRGKIIEGLFSKGYLIEKKKSVFPTEKAMQLFEVMPESTLTSPVSTAEMEMALDEVSMGTMTRFDYMKRIDDTIVEIIDAIKGAKTQSIHNGSTAESLGVCPCCKSPVTETKISYGCSNWKNGCQFRIWKEISGKKITAAVAKKILEKGKSGLIKDFTYQNGDKYNGYLILEEDGSIKVQKEGQKDQKGDKKMNQNLGTCIYCGAEMREHDKNFGCPNYKAEGQHATIWKNAVERWGGADLDGDDCRALMNGERIIVTLKSKSSGKEYKKYVFYDKENNRVQVDWDSDCR